MSTVEIRAQQKADHFINNEKQFHLGFLLTEQPHPGTIGLSEAATADTAAGVKIMQNVDRDIIPVAEKVFSSKEFRLLTDSIADSVINGGKVVFSGCGATGRLSILLEAAWRTFCRKCRHKAHIPETPENNVFSIMTGGDYALIRSVESFEDHMEFGKRQIRETGVGNGDTVIAISEGGETSSVIGTALEAIENGARVFFVFNNPAAVLKKHIIRSRLIIDHPDSVVMDLSTGPMALAGSTRLQAVTAELLIIGAAVEKAAHKIFRHADIDIPFDSCDVFTDLFSGLLDDLESESCVQTMCRLIELEQGIYSEKGLVTYFADSALLDIFTDTTERAPTFMLPPFVKSGDASSSPSWAFVKNPLYPTEKTWTEMLARPPRCLEWTHKDYETLGAPDDIIHNPPKLDKQELLRFTIGNEPCPKRSASAKSVAAAVLSVSDTDREMFLGQFSSAAQEYPRNLIIHIGEEEDAGFMNVPCRITKSPLMLWEHLAVKLVMNTVSTLTMAKMGRITGNWMSWVEATNKKLVDRGSRLISEICSVPHAEACYELFLSIEQIRSTDRPGQEKPSPVRHAIERIRRSRPGAP